MENEKDLWNKVLSGAMALPFVEVDRESFLRKELALYCNIDELNIAVNESPTKVLNEKQISRIANGCIKYHLVLVFLLILKEMSPSVVPAFFGLYHIQQHLV